MKKKIIALIRSRNAEEAVTLLKSYQAEGREWLQENGELSFVLGIAAGVVVILFFKLLVLFLALSVLACAGWWFWLERQKGSVPNDSQSE
jgi:hypothetical protein